MGQSVSSQIIETIANFYEDSNSALKLLRRYTKKGNILLPEEIMPLEDFYRLERRAWEKRKKYSVDHSNAILERHFRNENTHRESFFGGKREPRNLDDIERRRDWDGQYEGKYGKHSE